MTAITIIVNLLERVAGDDAETQQLLQQLKTEIQADEAKIATDEQAATTLADRVTAIEEGDAHFATASDLTSLTARVTALEGAPSAPVDLTALTDRVTALETRNTSDDSAAGVLNPNPGGSSGGDPTTIVLGALSPTTATVGDAYTAVISAAGGVAPLAFSMLSGALPDGLSLSSGGAISGTPTTAGDFEFGIQAHDANNTVGQGAYSLAVVAAAAPVVAEPGAPAGGADGAGGSGAGV
jgi:hypothetical protein